MIAWLLTVGLWLLSGSGDVLADSGGTGEVSSGGAVAAEGSGTWDVLAVSDGPLVVSDGSEEEAVSDTSEDELAVGVVESAGSAGFVAESYARDYSVSVDEAERRLGRIASLQEVMGSIRVLEGSRVAGWGIDHGEDFGAWVWLAGDEAPSVEAARVAAAHDDVEIRTGAAYTYEELRAAQDRIAPALVEDDPEISSKIAAMVVYTGIDMAANSVTVGIDSGSGSGRSRRDATPGMKPDAEGDSAAVATLLGEVLQEHTGVGMVIADASGFSNTADFRGGEALYSCTAGFAAKQVGGPYGILTAGHCMDYQIMYGVRLPFVVGSDGTRADAQFHRIPFGSSRKITNDYKCGANAKSVCKVTGTAKRVDMMGEYICHTGKNSGVSCGEITDIVFSLSSWRGAACRDEDGNKAKCEPVFVKVQGPNLKACKGDSGSPVYNADGIAYGIKKGSSGGSNCGYKGVYMSFSAIDEVEDFLGVRVWTAPPSPPDAPQNLVGRFKTREVSGVELTWEPVEGAVNYSLYRRVSGSGKEYELIGTSRETSYVDLHSSLPPGFRYQYVVRAASDALLSEPSNDFQIDVMTSSDLRAEVSAYGYWVDLRWKLDPPATNTDVQHFEVLRRKASETTYTPIGQGACCSYRDRIGRGPLPGAEYLYRVRPKNRYGVVGSWGSSSDYATVQVPTTKPRARMADLGTLLRERPFRGVVVSWNEVKADVASYEVYRRAAVAGHPYERIGTISETKYYDPLTGLTPGMEYYYRIKTVSSTGVVGHWGSRSNYAAVRLPAVTGLQASVSSDSGSVSFTWTEPTVDVTRYEVYRRAVIRGQPYTKIGEPTTASYSDPLTGLVPGAEYYYRVKAVSAAGAVGSWGMGNNYVGVVAPAVGNLQAVAVGGGVSVSWEQSDGDVARYKVYRRAAVKGHAYTKIGETITASYLDQSTDLVPGTEYYYRVKPVGANGVVGGWGPGPNYASIRYRRSTPWPAR